VSTERARELLGFAGSRQRYPDVESVRELASVSDPETLEDETAGSIREWMADNRRLALSLSLLGGVTLVLVLYFTRQYIPLIVGNRFVQAGVVLCAVFLVGMRFGWNANQRRVEDIDEVSFQISGEGQLTAKGLVTEGDRTRPPLAVPVKGYRDPGKRPRPYTVEEIDPQLLERLPTDIDPNTPAMIRMHPTYTTSTDWAGSTRSVQLTDGFEPVQDPMVHDDGIVVLKATAPCIADSEEVREINRLNEELQEEKKQLQKEKEDLEQRVDDLTERLTETDPIDKVVDKELARVKDTLRAARGQGRPRRENGEGVFKQPRREDTDSRREQSNGEAVTDGT